jgi:ABC-type oligopeptide transport system substrate-binding subunit
VIALRRLLLITLRLAILLAAGYLLGCRAAGSPVQRVEVRVPVAETRLVVVTSEVTRAVVATATPPPTPAYVSRIDAPPGTLLYPLPADPLTLDPQEAADEASRLVVGQVYEDLYTLRGDGSLSPAARSGYNVAADGRAYTITLRSGLVWPDGQPVRAQDYVEGACRLLDPAVGNPRRYLLADVARVTGAREYAAGASPDCSRVGIRAEDERTLAVTLQAPLGTFPELMAQGIFLPAPQVAWEEVDELKPTSRGGFGSTGT